MKTLKRCSALLGVIFISVVLASPSDSESSNKVPRSPEIDDDFPEFKDDEDTTEKPKTSVMGRIGKFFNDIIQIPINMFKAVNSLLSNQSFSKLRDEVRNLNISYPKSG